MEIIAIQLNILLTTGLLIYYAATVAFYPTQARKKKNEFVSSNNYVRASSKMDYKLNKHPVFFSFYSDIFPATLSEFKNSVRILQPRYLYLLLKLGMLGY